MNFADPQLWFLVSFVLFFGFLGRPFMKKILAQLDERRALIAAQLDAVRNIHKDVKALYAERRETLKQIDMESQKILYRAHEDAAALRVRMEKQFQEELQKKRVIYDNMFTAMHKKHVTEMEEKVVAQALAVTSILLHDVLSPEDHDKIIAKKTKLLRTYH